MGNESNTRGPAPRGSDGTGPNGTAVLLHGFTQNHRCLGPIADQLARHTRVLTPDLPGHGAASHLGSHDCPAAATHLVDTCGRGDWFGYSLGGRVALHVALGHPDAVDSLVLVGATPGIEDPLEREQRREIDRGRALLLAEVGVEEFCRRWLQLPMFADLPEWARFLPERTTNTVDGLSGSLLNAGTGSMHPLWTRLGDIEAPVLVLAGERDERFSATGELMARAIGSNATFSVVPGAGHAAHLEAPEGTAELISRFRAGLAGSGDGG